jgi:hypothetical protein
MSMSKASQELFFFSFMEQAESLSCSEGAEFVILTAVSLKVMIL